MHVFVLLRLLLMGVVIASARRYEPTTMIRCPSDTAVYLGESSHKARVTFSCEANFDWSTATTKTITWWRGSQQLWRDSDHNCIIEETRSSYSSLTILLEDVATPTGSHPYAGIYTCIAHSVNDQSTLYSKANCSVTLSVKGASTEKHSLPDIGLWGYLGIVGGAVVVILGVLCCMQRRTRRAPQRKDLDGLRRSEHVCDQHIKGKDAAKKWVQVVDVLALNYAMYIRTELPEIKKKIAEWKQDQMRKGKPERSLFGKYIIAVPGNCKCPKKLTDVSSQIEQLDELSREKTVAGSPRIFKTQTYSVKTAQGSKLYFTAEVPAPIGTLAKLRANSPSDLLSDKTPELEEMADRFMWTLAGALRKTLGNYQNDCAIVMFSDMVPLTEQLKQTIQPDKTITADVVQPKHWLKWLSGTKSTLRDPLKCDNPAFGLGLAYNFYFGYIEKIIPGLSDRLQKIQEGQTDAVLPKFVLLISKTGRNPQSVKEVHKEITLEKNLANDVTTASIVRRDFSHPIYEVRNSNNQVINFTGNFCSCLDTLFFVKENNIAAINTKAQRDNFVRTLKGILGMDVMVFEYEADDMDVNDQLYEELNKAMYGRLQRDRTRVHIVEEDKAPLLYNSS